ncbi:thermonuclease family protein [Campylobacter helveticus]|uniref:thermonuclease family protein n=1 Tax=Campylobacter helveticus TaxID=28898 RepID=UPI0011165780|nr:thermonuclease family protein [Campylobacter helveticus]TNH32672.1 thermonuclease [Campylobacter helveticus]
MNSKTITLLKRMLKAKKLSLSLVIIIIVLAISSFNQVSSFNQSFTTFLAQKNLEKELTGKVSKVIDGDTIELLVKQEDIKQSPKIKVRLFGIDAPEKKQAFGKEAKEYLSALVLKQEVNLIIENKDKYDRFVGTLFLKGQDINKEMVKNGYAWAYESYSTRYLAQQADAQMFKLGLFKDENAIKPSEFRKRN